jgi:hypothetical protein
VLKGIQDIVFVSMGHDCATMFQDFTTYTCKRYTWIHNFLSNRTQAVLLEGEASDYIPVMYGVPQSSVLGTSLFLFCFICMFELVSMYGVCVYYWCFFRLMESTLHLSGWKAILYVTNRYHNTSSVSNMI